MQIFSFPKFYSICFNGLFCDKHFNFINTCIYSLGTTGENWQLWTSMKVSRFNQDFQCLQVFLICSLLHLECFLHWNRKQATFYLGAIWVQGAMGITKFHCWFSFLHYFTPNYIGLPKKEVLQFRLEVLLTSLAAWISIKISKISIYHEE